MSVGILSPPGTEIVQLDKNLQKLLREPHPSSRDPELIDMILETGGIYGIIASDEAQENFVDLVTSNGATPLDGNGELDSGGTRALLPGVKVAGKMDLGSGSATFSYQASTGEKITFTIEALDIEVLRCILRDVRGAVELEVVVTNEDGEAVVRLEAERDMLLELEVRPVEELLYRGVLWVGLESDKALRKDPKLEVDIVDSKKLSQQTVLSLSWLYKVLKRWRRTFWVRLYPTAVMNLR